MPNWNEVLNEINERQIEINERERRDNALDSVRRKYLKQVSDITGRNTIAYYSGFLQKPRIEQTSIDDDDKNGFMSVIHKLDCAKGLDLILHTPGGNLAAAESLVDYLQKMFGSDIRAIVPQIAMSAGTMMACSCKEIIMGKESNLGPIDPQFRGIPASGVVEEFQRAFQEIKLDATKIPIWQVIISKYDPTFIGECEKAISWSKEIVHTWLKNNMFANDPFAEENASKVVDFLSDHENTKSHSRHITIDECKYIGLKVIDLEGYLVDRDFQDAVLSMHHAYMHTFSNSTSIKIIENQNGIAMVRHHNPN